MGDHMPASFTKFLKPLIKPVHRYRMRRLRRLIRAHYKSNRSSTAGARAVEVFNRMAERPVLRHCAYAGVPPEASGHADAFVRQSLVALVGYRGLMAQLLAYKTGTSRAVCAPIPAAWRQALQEQGVAVDVRGSRLQWVLLQGALFAKAGVKLMRLTKYSLAGTPRMGAERPYRCLVNCPPSVLPPPTPSTFAFRSLGTWFIQRCGEDEPLFHVAAVPPQPVADGGQTTRLPWPPLAGLVATVHYLSRTASALLQLAFAALKGDGGAAVVAGGVPEALYFCSIPSDKLAKEYLFTNSDYVVRPLWTYVAEARGADVVLVFYSCNCETLEIAGMQRVPPWIGYPTMTWSRYLAWDEYQISFLQNCGVPADTIEEIGPIPLIDAPVQLPDLTPPVLAVFEVQPHRVSGVAQIGFPHHYYSYRTSHQFLEDVWTVARRHGFTVALKIKRNIGASANPQFRRFIQSFSDRPGVVALDPRCSAERVILASDAVVSMPFTSTGVLAKHLSRPSVYYDPTATLVKNQRPAHGVPLLQDIDALEKWLCSHVAADPGRALHADSASHSTDFGCEAENAKGPKKNHNGTERGPDSLKRAAS